jgi:hypothetical protein
MAIGNLAQFPTDAPQIGQDQQTFDNNTSGTLGYMNTFVNDFNGRVTEVNNTRDEIEINKDIVQENKDIVQENKDIVENNTKISTSVANYKGEYNNDNSYGLGDCISFSNSRYISKVDDNTTQPTDSDSWLKIGGIMSNGKNLGDFIVYENENVVLINPITFTSLNIGSGSTLKLI